MPPLTPHRFALVTGASSGIGACFARALPADTNLLLTARNANWAGWIENRLEQPGTVFIAVGAGHLAGKGSVQDQLKRRGLKVKRIWQ